VGSQQLDIWICGNLAGHLVRSDKQLSFEYDDEYRKSRHPALSVSMPKHSKIHMGDVVENWFDNLLPDNDAVRTRWAAAFSIRRPSAIALLAHMGLDCAGAVQVVPTGQIPDNRGNETVLTDVEIEERIATLHTDDAAWTPARRIGKWSLGGAQGKFALSQSKNGDWLEPSGRSASTHIFKIGVAHEDLAAARATFFETLIFNWLVVGIDAHATNFSPPQS